MAKQEATKAPEPMNSAEMLQEKIAAMRAAQKVFATFTQEQVDKIFFEAAMAANKQRIPLAKMACEETGMGVVEDKVIKNHYAAEYQDLRRDRGGHGLRNQKDCRACRSCGRGYPDHKSDLDSNL